MGSVEGGFRTPPAGLATIAMGKCTDDFFSLSDTCGRAVGVVVVIVVVVVVVVEVVVEDCMRSTSGSNSCSSGSHSCSRGTSNSSNIRSRSEQQPAASR